MTARPVGVGRRALRLAGIFVGLLVVFVLLMTAVYALPQGRIVTNLRRSQSFLASQGLRPYMLMPQKAYQLDNFTDALMLDTAISTQPGGPLVNAMGDYKQISTNASGAPDTILALSQSIAGHRDAPEQYAYYWHGYQVLLRPALLVFTYSDIRYLNLIALTALVFGIAILLARRAGARAGIAFGLSLAAAGFFIVPFSLQYSSMTYVALGAVLVVLALGESSWLEDHVAEFFLVVGMLAAFFDLLTFPVLTLGMPLAIALVLATREVPARRWVQHARFAAVACIAWAVGYAGAWVAKWFIGAAVIKTNVVGQALAQLLFRSGASDAKPQALRAIGLNLADLVPMLRPSSIVSSVVFVGGLALVVAVMLVVRRAPAEQIRASLPVLLVVPLPYLWYAAASNHSAIHNWFTYRGQAFAVFAVVYVVLSAIDFERLGDRFPKRGETPSA